MCHNKELSKIYDSDDSEIEKEILDTDDNQDSDYEELSSKLSHIQPYQYEPEKAKGEIHENQSESENEFEEEAENNTLKDKVRIGNLTWCLCGECCIEQREIDCLCCQEVSAITEGKFEGKNLYYH